MRFQCEKVGVGEGQRPGWEPVIRRLSHHFLSLEPFTTNLRTFLLVRRWKKQVKTNKNATVCD